MGALTDLRARKLAAGGKPIADGTVRGLRLEPGAVVGRSKWILRFVSPEFGKRRGMGLGTFSEIGLSDARRFALEARRIIVSGRDPVTAGTEHAAARRVHSLTTTFEEAAQTVHKEQKPGWKNAKHADQRINTLSQYVFPLLGFRKIETPGPSDFADALRPIWPSKPETAARVKQRCHRIMNACVARRLVVTNPIAAVDNPGANSPPAGHAMARYPVVR